MRKEIIRKNLREQFKDGIQIKHGRHIITVYINGDSLKHLPNDLLSDRLGLDPNKDYDIAKILSESIKSKSIGGSNKNDDYNKHKNSYDEYKYRIGYIDGKQVTFNIGVLRENGQIRHILYAISPIKKDNPK